MDTNEEIRFRVIDEDFTDLTPTGPTASASSDTAETTDQKKTPYGIVVCLNFLAFQLVECLCKVTDIFIRMAKSFLHVNQCEASVCNSNCCSVLRQTLRQETVVT